MAEQSTAQDSGAASDPTPNTSLSLSHPKDVPINTGFPVSAASEIQVGSRKTITGEHQIYINAARKPKVSATEAHILKNKPRDHSSQRLKCFENVDMRPQYKEGGNWEALGAS